MSTMYSAGVRAIDQDLSSYAANIGGNSVGIVGVFRNGPIEPTVVTDSSMIDKIYGEPVTRVDGAYDYTGLAIRYAIQTNSMIIAKRVTNGNEANSETVAGGRYKFKSKYPTAELNGYKITVEDLSYGDNKQYAINVWDSSLNLVETLECDENEGSDNHIQAVVEDQSSYIGIEYDRNTEGDLATWARTFVALVKNTPTDDNYIKISTIGGTYTVSTTTNATKSALLEDNEIKLTYPNTATVVEIKDLIDDLGIHEVAVEINGTGALGEMLTGEVSANYSGNTLEGGNSGYDTAIEDSYYLEALNDFLDTENYDINLLAVPGKTSKFIHKEAISVIEQRGGDCLYVYDIPDEPTNEKAVAATDGINSKYARCSGYPWVTAYDPYMKIERKMPPSGFQLKAYGYNDNQQNVWWAAAGLKRGVFGDATGVTRSLKKGDRDYLQKFPNVVNPIVNFKANGVVMWGISTSQRISSSFCDDNVVRLLIYLKKIITASTMKYVFDPNDDSTWKAWKLEIDPVLRRVMKNRGVYDYKLEMGLTDKTMDNLDIDQGYMIGVVKFKPTRAAKYIPIYFAAYSSGASFEE